MDSEKPVGTGVSMTVDHLPQEPTGSEEGAGSGNGNEKGKVNGRSTAREQDTPMNTPAGPSKPAHSIRKLVPPRPFPTVPPSVSATGPRSAHAEGKNYMCITRKTPLGAYLRRCKDVFMKDGYKSLHLSAMGAAIPHLMQLTLSLPTILPFAQDEIRTEILTGTVEVQDEVIPDDEDDDISYRTRGKSTLSIVIQVGDGVDELIRHGRGKGKGRMAKDTVAAAGGNPGSGRADRRKDKVRDERSQRTNTRERATVPS